MKSLWIMLCLGLSAPASAEPSPEGIAAASMRQEALPSLKRRLETARERYQAANNYFRGDIELEAAWPELEGAPLLSAAYVQGQLARLQAQDEARVAERLSLPDPALREADARLWRKTLDEALDAEAAADQQERQLWTALSLGLRTAPALREEALDAQIAVWRAATATLPPPEDPAFAEAAAAARAAGEQEVVLRRYRLAALRAMTVPGDLSLVRLVTVDLLRQGEATRGPLEAEAAVDRLRRVQPLLPAALSAEVQQTLSAQEIADQDAQIAVLQAKVQETARLLVETAAPPEGVSRAALEAEAAAQQRALEGVQDETAARLTGPLPEASDVLGQRQHAVATLRLELAELEASLAAHRLSLSPSGQARSAEEGAIRTQAQVDDAQRKADEAQRLAQAAGKARLQALAEKLSQLSGQVAAAERTRQEEALASVQRLQEGQQARVAAILRAEDAPPALRRESLRTAYAEQLRWMASLRAAQRAREADVRRLTADNTRIRREEIPSEAELVSAADADPELVRSVQSSIDAILQALAERRAQALREQDQATRLLFEAQTQKRMLRERLSASDRAHAEREAEVDPLVRATDELLDVPMVFGERYRGLRDTDSWSFRGIFRQILAFLLRSAELLLLLFGWYVLRQNAASWLEQGLRFLQQIVPHARSLEQPLLQRWLSADLTGLTARLSPVIPPAADALVALLIHRIIFQASPLLGLLTLLWLARATLRLLPPLLSLLIVPVATEPPAPFVLLQTHPDTQARIFLTAQMLTRWWLSALVLHYTSYEVMRADFLSERISRILAVVLGALICREVLRWAPTIRAAVAAHGAHRGGRIVRWMAESPPGSLGRLLRAGAGLGYLLSLSLSQGATVLVEGRGGLGWIGSLIAQHSLKELNQTCLPIPEAARLRITAADPGNLLHSEELTSLRSHYTAWCADPRRGMIALIGERGSGKGEVLRRLQDLGSGEGRLQVRLSPPVRTTDQATILAWMAEAFGLSPADAASWHALRHALLALPSRVVFLDDAHRLLLRAVGGFTALREALDLMHATADRHFWVCAFHGPTWSFLEGTAIPINLEVFRAQVRVAPLDPADLSAWVLQATRDAGYNIRFDNLATAGVRNADLGRELIRIESAFWRRLNDISNGNPQVAFQYWLDSLRLPPSPPPLSPTAGEGGDGLASGEASSAERERGAEVLDVALLSPPDSAQIEGLTDIDLFVLTAVLIHDGLSVDMLSFSLNAHTGEVRASCRHLEGLGVLYRDDGAGTYHIQVRWRPTATRLLRQKHFLHQR